MTVFKNVAYPLKVRKVNKAEIEKFVEKGWDEEKQMYYYLVYFNKEQKS